MSEESLSQIRRNKHLQANGGNYPLAQDGSSIIQVISQFDTLGSQVKVSIDPNELPFEVCVHGRISAFRKAGSICFIKLVDSSGSIQVLASKSAFADFDQLKQIDLGDIVEVTGRLCFSKTQEKSILLLQMRLLSKAILPPPEKFAGLSDPEIRYRKRYLDLLSSEESRAVAIVRSYTIRAIRAYLENQSFLEVETPTLTTVNSGANAKPFTTHHNTLDLDLYLRIAPELYLKRLLVGGLDRVFEIGKSFRNEGVSTRHNPEFTMLEFYQAYGTFENLIDHTNQLFSYVESYLENNLPLAVRNIYLTWRDNRSFTFSQPVRLTMLQAVHNAASKAGLRIDMGTNEVSLEEVSGGRKIDVALVRKAISECTTVGQKLSVMFEHMAEPFLSEDYRTVDGRYSVPVFITEYPKDICPLARSNDNDPLICDRFELYIEGRELCNAFQELNNPDEQKARFMEQLNQKQQDAMDYDADYIEALEYGMPPAIGFGMGIDRLVMLLTNSLSIKEVVLFPTMKPLG